MIRDFIVALVATAMIGAGVFTAVTATADTAEQTVASPLDNCKKPRWDAAAQVWGNARHGYTVLWCNGVYTNEPPKRRALRDCKWSYRNRLKVRGCKREVRTVYQYHRHLKKTLRLVR